jgi:hypothetical protein
MAVSTRQATSGDVMVCWRVIYEASKDIAEGHRFSPAFHSVEAATHVSSFFITHPLSFSIVAEHHSQVVGTCFLHERDAIRGVGGSLSISLCGGAAPGSS